MLSLQNILSSEGQEFLDNLLTKEVIVNEKLNAATLSFKKKHTSEMDLNRKLTFYKGSGSNKKEITITDKVMTTFYSAGMTYISNLSKLIIDRIPANWTFVCRYFPSHQPSFINYSVLPKNNLVLSCIITSGGTKIDEVDDLRAWAEMFDIAYQEPVFRGYLSEYQKEKLKDYLKGDGERTESFARFIITMLNPTLTHSLYQNDGFDTPIDGFIFKFVSDDGITKPVSAKLIDPYMTNIISRHKSGKAFKDNTDILLSDFSVFMMGQNIDGIVLSSKDTNERYLELFYKLFNKYISFKKSQLEDFDVDTNDVVKESIDVDFTVNIDEISNETTKRLLIDNPEYKSIFKTLLGSFKSKKPDDYISFVMSPGVVRVFNELVDKINDKVNTENDVDDYSFSSYLSAIKAKNVKELGDAIDNAPDEIKTSKPNEQVMDVETKDVKDVLSFADFKKSDEKKEKEEKKEEEKFKSIEDIIKDLKKDIDEVKDKLDDTNKKIESSNDKDESSDKDDKSDKDDDKKSKKSEDDSKPEDDEGDSEKDETSEKDDNKSEEDDNEENKESNDNGDDDKSNPLSSF